MIPLQQCQDYPDTFIRRICDGIKGIFTIVFRHFIFEEVVKQEWQQEQYMPHIDSTNRAWDCASLSDAFKNCGKVWSNRHKTVVHSSKAAKKIHLIILRIIILHILLMSLTFVHLDRFDVPALCETLQPVSWRPIPRYLLSEIEAHIPNIFLKLP